MRHSSELIVRAPASEVAAVVSDLATYPHWNDLVREANPAEPADGDAGPAWDTTLQAQVGPFARSKKLRFVRDQLLDHHDEFTIRFVRAEVDGKDHAAWTMHVEVDPVANASSLTLTLSYDGKLWVPALGNILHSAIATATERLPDYLATRR